MLNAISPLDGRYANKVHALSPYFSELGLIRYRVKVEILYFIRLCNTGIIPVQLSPTQQEALNHLWEHFEPEYAQKIKTIENTTNHDVKAVEYFIKEAFTTLQLQAHAEFIHFGLTSQDINNTAIPMLLQDYTAEILIPSLDRLLSKIQSMAKQWMTQAMMARTHGQPATPTTLGKELMVFVERLNNQIDALKSLSYSGKFGGATGNFNAHVAAYPHIDWRKWSDEFLATDLKITRQQYTTQIAHYDEIAEWCHLMIRIQTILVDLCRDFWTYISMDYFKQQIKPGEVGSSTMPHKVNPIDFENAEGNLGLATAIASHLAEKLPTSRLQRDLTDSTVLRNIGVPAGHLYLSILSIEKGLSKLVLNEEKLHLDLDQHWILLAEPIQTILRREGFTNPYELLKELTRAHQTFTKEQLHAFIHSLPIKQSVKQELLALRPDNYLGWLGITNGE